MKKKQLQIVKEMRKLAERLHELSHEIGAADVPTPQVHVTNRDDGGKTYVAVFPSAEGIAEERSGNAAPPIKQERRSFANIEKKHKQRLWNVSDCHVHGSTGTSIDP